ncbi:MAG: BatD family protein, partial [Woeseiaceae bacterium]|nr:BatD family protein [Woeseiaceae bacterium]
MVISESVGLRTMALLVSVFVLVSATAHAGVTSRIDRNTIDLNESFMLEVVVDTEIDLEPDISALDEGFYVGQSTQLSNTMIVNGAITRSRTWTYQLMAKRTGQLEIPPISVGAEQSQPIRITVREPANAPPGEADVFITSEVDFNETYVQAQVLYRIKVYRAVATRQPALRDPVFGGAEVLIEVAGDERSYEALLNERTYNVVERVYAVFPQESGEVTISPARFEARVLRDGRITGRKVFESQAHTVKVLPIPAPP